MFEVASVVGARPQFVKLAVVSKALKSIGVHERIIHTGQHYDDDMSGSFLRLLGIDEVSVNLSVGSGSQTQQTAEMMVGIETYLNSLDSFPSGMILFGDTNSTLAGALVASKLHIPIFHVEAGLRSFNKEMPEEVNRILVDHLSDLLLCPSGSAVTNLLNEGIESGVSQVGDVMLDAFHEFTAVAKKTKNAGESLPLGDFALTTIHRPTNADDVDQLKAIVRSLETLDMQIVWPVHPRTNLTLKKIKLPEKVICTSPMDYFSMLVALDRCSLVVTDSGGLQKEAYWAKKPCLTMRQETEWHETLDGGWNSLCVPGDNLREKVASKKSKWLPLYGDGKSGTAIVNRVKLFLQS